MDNMDWYRRSTNISKIEDIPDGEHWVAVEDCQFHIPGDERSQTHPGHGYPAHTERAMRILLFQDKDAMESYIRYQDEQRHGKAYKILHIRTPVVKKTVSIDIE